MMFSGSSAPVLVLNQNPDLRHSLSRDLTRVGFETIPTVSSEEAERFFRALKPQLVVAPFSELGKGTHFIDQLIDGGSRHTTLAIIGEGADQEESLPRSVVFVAGHDLSATQLSEKTLLLLLGRTLELPTDHAVEGLVGSLEQRPFLELLKGVVESGQSIQIRISGYGECWTRAGEVVAARTRAATGTKAFFRMARRQEGAFQIWRREYRGEANIHLPWDELLPQAIHESLASLPDSKARLALHTPDDFFARQYSDLEGQVLRLAQHSRPVQEALDLPGATDGLIADRLRALQRSGVLSLEAPHRPLRIVTDSTADLPASLITELGLVALPLTVHFGDKVFRDRVDIQPKNFYPLLTSDAHHPHTNPPSENAFEKVFTELNRESDVLSIHISKNMSKTFEIAEGTAQKLREQRGETARHQLQIIDSKQVSLGLGLLAVLAASLAKHSDDLESLAKKVERISTQIQTLLVVDTLTYLERGGRINKAGAWLGTLLKVKPILGLDEGAVVPVERVRGGRAAYPRLAELLAERVDPSRPIIAMVAHANAPQWADRLRTLIQRQFDCGEVQVAEIGPVVGTHTGPGTVGVTAYQPLPEELPLLTGLR